MLIVMGADLLLVDEISPFDFLASDPVPFRLSEILPGGFNKRVFYIRIVKAGSYG